MRQELNKFPDIDLVTNYESSVPPSLTTSTEITNYIYVENVISIDETNMQFSVTLDLVSTWIDNRLAYNSTTSSKSSVDMTSYISSVWHPQIQITDNVKDEGTINIIILIDILTERMTLSQNGTVSYSKRYILDLK